MTDLVSIVVPVYNSTSNLIALTERVYNVFASQDADFELIFVDDASTEPGTWETLERLNQEYSSVRCFTLMRNFGQQAATLCGIAQAKGNYIVTMDDDLQHRPEDIPALLEYRHHDIVIGQFSHKQHSLFKRMSSKIKGTFDRFILGKPKEIQLSAFRLLSRKVTDGILSIKTTYPFIPAMMLYVSKDIKGVMLQHDARKEGNSGYTFLKMLNLFANLLINNSSALLRFVGGIGLLFSLFSFILAGYFVIRKVTIGITVPGWTSVILLTTFGNGLVLFIIGIVGEYLVRIISSVEQKPVYIIRTTLDQRYTE